MLDEHPPLLSHLKTSPVPLQPDSCCMAAGSNSLAPAHMRSALGSISLRLMPQLFRLRP